MNASRTRCTGSGRPPRGGRGLKLRCPDRHPRPKGSPPARGARIETLGHDRHRRPGTSRPPRGGRGLKPVRRPIIASISRRPPRGGRGLKLDEVPVRVVPGGRPPRGGRGLKPDSGRLPLLVQVAPASMVWISRIHADSCRTSPFHRLTCDNRSPRRSRERCPTVPGAGHEEPVFPWSRANFRHHVLRLVRKTARDHKRTCTQSPTCAIQTRFGVTATQAPRGGRGTWSRLGRRVDARRDHVAGPGRERSLRNIREAQALDAPPDAGPGP